MMEILVFLVVTFGLLSVFVTQYISQYREIYLLWIEEIVFKGYYNEGTTACNPDKREKHLPGKASVAECSTENIKLCSKVESYSREICAYANIIKLLVILICFIAIIALIITKMNTNEAARNMYYAVQVLIVTTLITVISLLHQAKINVIRPSRTSQIDERLFDMWCKSKCHLHKQAMFQKELRPTRMYEILAEKINEYDISGKNNGSEIIELIIKKKIEKKLSEIEGKSNNVFELMNKDKNLAKRLNKNRKNNHS